MKNKNLFYMLGAAILATTACNNKCESGVPNGIIKGKVILAGTQEPAEGVQINLVQTETTSGFPPSTNYIPIAEAFTTSEGTYSFTQDDTGPFSNLDVQCMYDSKLYWSSKQDGQSQIRQTDCGISENFVLYPKAKLEVKIGSIKMPENATKGHIYNGKSDTSIVFTKDNPPSESIILDVVGNVTDTFYLRFDRWDTIYNTQFPNGYAYDVKLKLIKLDFKVDAWSKGEYILNYP